MGVDVVGAEVGVKVTGVDDVGSSVVGCNVVGSSVEGVDVVGIKVTGVDVVGAKVAGMVRQASPLTSVLENNGKQTTLRYYGK